MGELLGYVGEWEGSIKVDMKEIECEGVDKIELTQIRVHWRAFVNTLMNLGVSW
jgi:hypothetical protein